MDKKDLDAVLGNEPPADTSAAKPEATDKKKPGPKPKAAPAPATKPEQPEVSAVEDAQPVVEPSTTDPAIASEKPAVGGTGVTQPVSEESGNPEVQTDVLVSDILDVQPDLQIIPSSEDSLSTEPETPLETSADPSYCTVVIKRSTEMYRAPQIGTQFTDITGLITYDPEVINGFVRASKHVPGVGKVSGYILSSAIYT